MARCRFCKEKYKPIRPMQPCCQKLSCMSAAYAEQVEKRKEKGAMARAPIPAPKKLPSLRQKRSTTTPTKVEREWMDGITDLGCIVCLLKGYGYVRPAVHHLKEGNRRLGHLATIPLCDPGHHQNAPAGSGEISRHPNKARFEAAYGTEKELLEATKKALVQKGWQHDAG